MKKWIVRSFSLGLVLTLLPLLWGCSRSGAKPVAGAPAATNPVPATGAVPAEPTPSPVAEAATNAFPDEADEVDPASAPAQPVSAEKPLPPNVRSFGPVAELSKLVQSGVGESVLQAFVANYPSPFNLSADEIIYFNDQGVPISVLNAVLQHDQALKNVTITSSVPARTTVQPTAPASDSAAASVPSPDVAAYPPPAPSSEPALAPPTDIVQSSFDEGLSPYGTWVDLEGYGRCWQPTVVVANPEWQPYFDGGHWIYSDCGWYWVSDYSWGWAPFHYGRWFRHSRLGWCWAPDTVWGPSWVCWRYTDGYCGWAPLPPGARFHPGVGLTFRGAEAGLRFDFGLNVNCFAFVAWGHFNEHHLRQFDVPRERAEHIYHQSTVSSAMFGDAHRVSNHGLAPEQVAAATHTPVQPVVIRERNGSGPGAGRPEHLSNGGHTMEVFHPAPAPTAHPATVAARNVRPEAAPAAPQPGPRSTWTVIGQRSEAAEQHSAETHAPTASHTEPTAVAPSAPPRSLPATAGTPSRPAQPAAAVAHQERRPASATAVTAPPRVERASTAERVETSRPMPAEARSAYNNRLSSSAPAPGAAAGAPPAATRPTPLPNSPPATQPAPVQPPPRPMPQAPAVPRVPEAPARPVVSAPAASATPPASSTPTSDHSSSTRPHR